MSSSTSSYRLKRFLTSKDPDFASALLIYVRYTPPSIRSDSREIAYWLDHFANSFGDYLYIFGFYRNKQLVAYAHATYFPKEYLYFIDYVTIDERYRGGENVFFELVAHMRQYLENAHPDYRYGVTEVMNEPGQDHPSPAKKILIRLLKIIGFRVIHAPYFQPRLMLNDSESELLGSLLIYSPSALDRIRSETYLSILRTLYYEHYLRWQSIEPSTKKIYKKHLDALYSKIEANIRDKTTLVVDGYHEIIPPLRPPVATQNRILSFSLQALSIIVLLTVTMLFLRWLFNLSNTSFASIYGLAISSFVAVAAIVSKEARVMFGEFASLAKYFFGRRGVDSRPTELESVHSSQPNPNDQALPPNEHSELREEPMVGVHGSVSAALPENQLHEEDS
jgi:hypothetical protein